MLGDDVGGLRATALMSVMGSAAIDDQINPHLHLSAAFAGGEVFTTHLLNKLLAEAFYNPRVVRLLELLVHGDAVGNRLRSVPMPAQLDGARYAKVFEHFVRLEALTPLGLFRTGAGSASGADVCYVCTNPPRSMRVRANDCVFVLGTVGAARPSGEEGARENKV